METISEGSSNPEQVSITSNIEGDSADGRKTRKPYTIKKQRESWTDEEHQKFLEALKLYNRDWKKIEKFIGTKTVIQIRSHAQKYFQKLQKNNDGEQIPPPRPKRKSSSQSREPVTVPWVATPEKLTNNTAIFNANSFNQWMAWNGLIPGGATEEQQVVQHQKQQQEQLQQAQEYLQQAMNATQNHLSRIPQDLQRGPNFAKIYRFLGSLFDPSVHNHTEELSAMSPIDRETIRLLMHNLSLNLANHQFREQHAHLLEKYQGVFTSGTPDEPQQEPQKDQSLGTEGEGKETIAATGDVLQGV